MTQQRRRAVVAGLITILIAGVIAALILWFLASRRPTAASSVTPTRVTSSQGAAGASGAAVGPNATPLPTATRTDPGPQDGEFFCDHAFAASPANPHLAADVAALVQARGTQIEVAWWSPEGIVTVGGVPDAPAWSTSKVPVSLAVMQAPNPDQHKASMSQALRSSDNQAADRLWRSLGETDEARSQRVTAVLRQAGDTITTVPTSTVTQFSVFGQTRWTPAAQVAFLGKLPCLPGGGQIVSEMGQVDRSQRWGMGSRPEAVQKPGWGPTPDGAYIARQFGWYADGHGGRIPVAIVVRAANLDAATHLVSEVADKLG